MKIPEVIIIHLDTKGTPYKNEDDIYEELKRIKILINRQYSPCMGIFISAPIVRLGNKKVNSILKGYVMRCTIWY